MKTIKMYLKLAVMLVSTLFYGGINENELKEWHNKKVK